MAEIKAFGALRFTDKAGDISKNVCPPYDIISENERLEYLSGSENNIIRLELPKGDTPYEDAAKKLSELLKKGVLKCDDENCIYIYEEEFSVFGETKKIKGIFVRVKLCEFSEGVVLPHEETLSKAKTDRFNLMSTTFCNFSPIYSMYADNKREIPNKINELSKTKPQIEFADKAGIIQRLWVVSDKEQTSFIEKTFADKQLFIADGHHRYETALNFKKKLISDGVIKSEDHPGNYVMMFLVDMDNEGLVVFPTHRIIKGLSDFNGQKALSDISEYFEATKIERAEIQKKLTQNKDKKAYCFCLPNNEFYLLVLKTEKAKKAIDEMLKAKSEAYRELDVSILHTLILEKLFGIDKENMANQINLTYTRDENEAVDGVQNGIYQCAFILNPTKVSEIKDVALANDKMPQKSTYFYPKIITGLVMNQLVDLV